jgi:hypothetical protein
MKRLLSTRFWMILFVYISILGFAQYAIAQKNTVKQENYWVGQYRFFDEQSNGRTDAPSDFVDYKITISEKDGQLIADFSWKWMTNEVGKSLDSETEDFKKLPEKIRQDLIAHGRLKNRNQRKPK